MHHPTDRIVHTTAFVTPVVMHWPEREIAQWVHPMKDRSDDPSHHERTLLPRSYISLPYTTNTECVLWSELALTNKNERMFRDTPAEDKQQGFFYMHHPTDRITPVVEHWLEREIAQWVHPMKDRSDDPSHHDTWIHTYIRYIHTYIRYIHTYMPEPGLPIGSSTLGVDRVVSGHHVYHRFIEHPFYGCLGGRMVSVAD